MSIDEKPPRRRSLRIPGCDYSKENWFFVTLCVQGRSLVFGELVEGKMHLSALGEIVDSIWNSLPQRFPNVQLDEYIVMTDHFHGILVIDETSSKARSLGYMLGQFKGASSFLIHKYLPEFHWQRNFYEHIIRNDEDLEEIRRYILENPLRHWLKIQKP